MESKIFPFAFFLLSIFGNTFGLKDGDIYKFESIVDNNVLTASGKEPVSGANITAENWIDGSNQKWLAIELSGSSDTYILLPKRQSWDWDKFIKGTSKDTRKDHIPDLTIALTGNSDKHISEQAYSGDKRQQWKTVDAGRGKSLLKNLADDKCIMNVGILKKKESIAKKTKNKITSLFHKKSKKSPASELKLENCDSSEEKQLWKAQEL